VKPAPDIVRFYYAALASQQLWCYGIVRITTDLKHSILTFLFREMKPGRFTFLDMAKMDNDGDFPGPAVDDRIRLIKFAVLCLCMSLFCVVNKSVGLLHWDEEMAIRGA